MSISRTNKKTLDRFTPSSRQEKSFDNTPLPVAVEEMFWHTKTGKVWMTTFGILIVASLEAGIFMYSGKMMKPTTPTTAAALAQPVADLPLTGGEEAAIDKTSYTIEVLNGSGLPGAAAKTRDLLENAAFTVTSIGNADRSASGKTVIQVKKTVPKEFLDMLQSTLKTSYTSIEVSELDKSTPSDIVIIVGSK